MADVTLIVHVTCPLCGDDLGPVRFPGDLLQLLDGMVIERAYGHCFDRHPEVTGSWDFHVETDVDRERTPVADGGEITAVQIVGDCPIFLPVPALARRRIERQRLRKAELGQRDERFLRALRELGSPGRAVDVGRWAGISGQRSRYCAERLVERELIERLPDGKLQAR